MDLMISIPYSIEINEIPVILDPETRFVPHTSASKNRGLEVEQLRLEIVHSAVLIGSSPDRGEQQLTLLKTHCQVCHDAGLALACKFEFVDIETVLTH